MPTPPDYETTRKVYFYVWERAESDGRVPLSLRKIANGVGRSFSVVRWHILHLQDCGLVLKRREANHLNRTIYISNMEMKDPEEVLQIISAFPRIPWHKRGQQDETDETSREFTNEVARVQATQRNAEEDVGRQVSSILSAALNALQGLPQDAEEWKHIVPGFCGIVADILETKKAATEKSECLDNLLAEMRERHSELLEFFEIDARHWFAVNLSGRPISTFRVAEDLWGERRWFPPRGQLGSDLQKVYDLAVEFEDLLLEYAPIHERGAVASEEVERAKRRLQLVPAILEVGESLGSMMPTGEGGPTRAIEEM